jgi:hypothetical protein
MTGHPFDSHPPLSQRIEAVGMQFSSICTEQMLVHPAEDSWYSEITTAQQIEDQLWSRYQEEFRQMHELSLAYRYVPDTPEERAIVEKYFPRIEITGKDGKRIEMDHYGVYSPQWELPIPFKTITQCSVHEGMLNKVYLKIQYNGAEVRKTELCVSGYDIPVQEVLALFNKYYSRYLTVVEYQKKKASA